MLRHAACALVMLMVLTSFGWATELLLQPSQELSGEFGRAAADEAYMVEFSKPQDFDKTFLTEISFYGKGYGDFSGLRGALVIYGAPEDEESLWPEDDPRPKHTVKGTQMFMVADLPAAGGWHTLKFEPFPVPSRFLVVIYPYNTEERGMELMLSSTGADASLSGYYSIAPPEEEIERLLHEPEIGLYRKDQRNFMINVKVADTVPSRHAVSAAELAGAGFAGYDDGVAEGFITTQRYGPMLHYKGSQLRKLKNVYIYGQLDGKWFESEHMGGLYLMDKHFRLIDSSRIPYALFTNEASWTRIELGRGVSVPEEFYVLVEPTSRPSVELLIGYDASTTNQASTFGTVGSELDWQTEAPEESTNWMIRLEFE